MPDSPHLQVPSQRRPPQAGLPSDTTGQNSKQNFSFGARGPRTYRSRNEYLRRVLATHRLTTENGHIQEEKNGYR